MRRFIREEGPTALLAALVVASCILVLGTLLGWWRSEPSPPAGPGLSVASASLTPQTVQFGDPVEARVDVIVGPAIDPSQLRVEAWFPPYETAGQVEHTRQDLGDGSLVRFRFRLVCLQEACLPPPGRTFAFPDGHVVDARGTALRRFSWPLLTVGSRLTTGDLTRRSPPWQAPVEPLPSPHHNIAPGLAYWLLLAFGALALLGGVLLAARALGTGSLRGLAARRRLSPLAEAVALTRQAAGGDDVEAQRQALERLAVELRRHERGELAKAAVRLAWSEEHPSQDEMLSLAGRAQEPAE